jgi:hypothetical protein
MIYPCHYHVEMIGWCIPARLPQTQPQQHLDRCYCFHPSSFRSPNPPLWPMTTSPMGEVAEMMAMTLIQVHH